VPFYFRVGMSVEQVFSVRKSPVVPVFCLDFSLGCVLAPRGGPSPEGLEQLMVYQTEGLFGIGCLVIVAPSPNDRVQFCDELALWRLPMLLYYLF